MSRPAIIVAVVVLGAAAVAALVLSGRFSPEARRERALRNLNTSGVVVRRACGLGEAHVDGARWAEMRGDAQRDAAAALASWCAEQGGASTMTIIDANSRARLAHWDGTGLGK